MAGDIHKSEYQSNKQQIRIFKRYALHPNYSSARGWMKIQYDIGIILVNISMTFIFLKPGEMSYLFNYPARYTIHFNGSSQADQICKGAHTCWNFMCTAWMGLYSLCM